MSECCKWEADHQRLILEAHGLAEEFHFGCDSIDMVADALVDARKQLIQRDAEIARLREALHTFENWDKVTSEDLSSMKYKGKVLVDKADLGDILWELRNLDIGRLKMHQDEEAIWDSSLDKLEAMKEGNSGV